MTDSIPGVPPRLPDGLEALIPAYLGRQRWYAGSLEPPAAEVRILAARELPLGEDPPPEVALHHAIVDSEGGTYQLLIGERPGGTPAEFLQGHRDAVLGLVGQAYFYDALVHPALSRRLLQVVTGGRFRGKWVRPIVAEQSNTSLVYDDRIILKVYRRLHSGSNPDVEVTTALAAAGFSHVAPPMAVWRVGEWDLAFAQQYLAGGSEGWALALTSLRDLFNSQLEDPAEAGGDFAGEATRLGRMTAEMHLAMVSAYGGPRQPAAEAWGRLLDSIEARLASAPDSMRGDLRLNGEVAALRRLRAVTDPGPVIRVHGDYHLGQVMQTDLGWFVLDFEGEPPRALDERMAFSSALKDIAGMVRSLGYATRFALTEREAAELDRAAGLAEAWELRNRSAFVAAYRSLPGVTALLPAEAHVEAVLGAYELDKALYELEYEQAYRPEWVPIPLSAIAGLLARLAG